MQAGVGKWYTISFPRRIRQFDSVHPLMKNTPPNWDLTDFYLSISDPKIEKDKKIIQNLASKFTKKYKGKAAKNLLNALSDYEKILDKLYRLIIFANLNFTTNTKDDEIKSLYQKTQVTFFTGRF